MACNCRRVAYKMPSIQSPTGVRVAFLCLDCSRVLMQKFLRLNLHLPLTKSSLLVHGKER